MATAKATASAELKKKKLTGKSKPKMTEEFNVSSKERDSDNEADSDCGDFGERDVHNVSKKAINDHAGPSFLSQIVSLGNKLINPSSQVLRATTPQHPGYEVIGIPPGSSPSNVMKPKIIKAGTPAVSEAVGVNNAVPAVQSKLESNTLQNPVNLARGAGCLVQIEMQQNANQQLINAAFRPAASGQMEVKQVKNLQQLQQMQQHMSRRRREEFDDGNVEEGAVVTAKAIPVAGLKKKYLAVKSKPKTIEEVTVSSDESDFSKEDESVSESHGQTGAKPVKEAPTTPVAPVVRDSRASFVVPAGSSQCLTPPVEVRRRIAHLPKPGFSYPLRPDLGPSSVSRATTPSNTRYFEDFIAPEMYLEYNPAKIKIGGIHPSPIIESTTLACVPPPDVWYNLHLPEKAMASLSALQLECITYCCQQHEQTLPDGSRAGFLIGDGTGVGKGRSIAGVIFENFELGRKRAVWISASSDLKYDAERDLRDIGAGSIPVYTLNKIVLPADINIKEGILYSPYSTLIGESKSVEEPHSRLKQLLHWCGEDFDGVIIFDECHRAKNLNATGLAKPTKTGLVVLELQKMLPKARIVYVSATAATELKNMAYMVRLGLWGLETPFEKFADFIGAIEKHDVKAMEIVAMEMKHRGMYIARQLSLKDVTFKVEEVPLSPDLIKSHNDSTKLWGLLLESFTQAADLVKADPKLLKVMWAQFWLAHQRFFKYLCIAGKVKHACKLATEAVDCGKCVVIGLQSTGEAQTLEQIENDGEISAFVSTAKGVLLALVENHFPALDRSRVHRLTGQKGASLDQLRIDPESSEGTKSGSKRKAACLDRPFIKNSRMDSSSHPEEDQDSSVGEIRAVPDQIPPPQKDTTPSKLRAIKKRLLEEIEKLAAVLPHNTLDRLIDELGGPDNVAEMTGRKGRVVQSDNGQVQYESRSEVDVPLETRNIREQELFLSGKKNIAVISEVASSGISFHAQGNDQRKRVHITLELSWSADKVLQQFGRTHRSNQTIAPEYIILISDLAGERRFTSTVAKRLVILGALMQGDRSAMNSHDLSQFNIDTVYGRKALTTTMKAVIGSKVPDIPPLADNDGEFLKDVAIALKGVGLICNSHTNPGVLRLVNESISIETFLNRTLGMEVSIQNRLFKYFTEILANIVIHAKESGKYEEKIMDLASDAEDVRCTRSIFACKYGDTTLLNPKPPVFKLESFVIERGMRWEEALRRSHLPIGPREAHEGFYCSKPNKFARTAVVLVANAGIAKDICVVARPNTGLQQRPESLADIHQRFTKVTPNAAKPLWKDLFVSTRNSCIHKYKSIDCKANCMKGQGQRKFQVLSGSILSVWTKFKDLLGPFSEMKIVRLRKGDVKVAGILVPIQCDTSKLTALLSHQFQLKTH